VSLDPENNGLNDITSLWPPYYRSRLEESRLLWQFYWDMAEEENWIKEMENILLQVSHIH